MARASNLKNQVVETAGSTKDPLTWWPLLVRTRIPPEGGQACKTPVRNEILFGRPDASQIQSFFDLHLESRWTNQGTSCVNTLGLFAFEEKTD